MLFVLGVSSTRRQVQIAARMGIKTGGAQGEKGESVDPADCAH